MVATRLRRARCPEKRRSRRLRPSRPFGPRPEYVGTPSVSPANRSNTTRFLTDQRIAILLRIQLIYLTIVRFLTDIGYGRRHLLRSPRSGSDPRCSGSRTSPHRRYSTSLAHATLPCTESRSPPIHSRPLRSTDVERWRSEARAITGNRVEVLEVSHHEVRARLDGNATLWRDIVRDGVTVYGLTIDELVEPVHA